MNLGDCFFNKATQRLPSHPWIILSDPNEDPDNVLIVNLADIENCQDHSCVVGPADHPGVFTKPSCVNYRDAKITSVALLMKARADGLVYAKEAVPVETLDKIIEGAIETDELQNAQRALLRKQQIIP
ncbi:MAG TPA: hypothetical protein PK867_18625 [Pirellulales bacterium]|nr:hypothetical protein [Pirellulales bacterium]